MRSRRIDNTYEFAFVSHATLEPHNCTAHFRDGECSIIGPLQMPASGRQIVAQALGIAPDKVHVQSTRIGGGFGRRLLSDYAAEAAVISRAIGAPVQVVDTRTGDLQHDYYRPAAAQRIRAGVDAAGRLDRLGSRRRERVAQCLSQGSAAAVLDGDLRALRRARHARLPKWIPICCRRGFRTRGCATARRPRACRPAPGARRRMSSTRLRSRRRSTSSRWRSAAAPSISGSSSSARPATSRRIRRRGRSTIPSACGAC